jgi:hypothetical protein
MLNNCVACDEMVAVSAKTCPKCGLQNPTAKVLNACTNCGNKNTLEAKKCVHCSVERPFSKMKAKCKNCQKEIHYATKLCIHCGQINPNLTVGRVILTIGLVACVPLFLFSYCDSSDNTKTAQSSNKTAQTSTKTNDAAYLGLAGQMLLEGDAEVILQAHILYKQGSYSLSSSIKKGCRVAKSRYNRSTSLTPKSKAIYKKLKPICDQYI